MSAFAGEKASRNDDWTKQDSDASIGGEEGDAGESEDDESEDEEEDDGKLDDDVKKEEAKGKIGIQQPLSKKEKAALKKQDLLDLMNYEMRLLRTNLLRSEILPIMIQ